MGDVIKMNPRRRILTFLQGVREETTHVSWPTRDELAGSTLVVFVGVAILATYIYAWDSVLTKTVQILSR